MITAAVLTGFVGTVALVVGCALDERTRTQATAARHVPPPRRACCREPLLIRQAPEMTEDDALNELKELIAEGGWGPLPGSFGGVLIYMRAWPDDSVDTLAVTGPTEVVAERTDANGCPVWRRLGAMTEVIAELRKVPAPDDPDAPRDILPALGGLA